MTEKVQPEDFKFWTKSHTRWGDMDGLRHINHAAYLSYMETARMEWLNELGFVNKRWEGELGVILASLSVDYFSQLHHPEELEIGLVVSKIGTKSFNLLTGIFNKGKQELIVQATFILVAFNYKLNKSIPVPDEIHDYLLR
jgi:acyl-CoA thioester hydrolase